MTNLEIVQKFYQAAGARDVPTALGLLHEEVTMAQTSAVPWGGEYHGQMGLLQFFGALSEHVKSTVEITEMIDAIESIVAIGYTRGTVEESGKEFQIRIAHVVTLREGKIVSIYPYIDTPGMLAALRD